MDGVMDGIHPHFTVRTSVSFLLLILLQSSTEAQNICSAPSTVEFKENNNVGDVVLTITVQPGVTLKFKPAPANLDNPFTLNRTQMIAARVLDYETEKRYIADIICTETATSRPFSLSIIVRLVNVNDNAPVFDQNLYSVNVNEMSPVGTTVGQYAATDLDQSQLYYKLESDPEKAETNYFALKSETDPDILVKTLLDYDKVKNVRLVLYAQDTPLAPAEGRPSFTATTTIMVTILDVDNRPPWFQPCKPHNMGGAVICMSAGYTGSVILGDKETGVLPLKPGPLYAVDGDSGINEEITYSFLSRNEGHPFEINPNTGNITMREAVNVLGTISLTVLAAQKRNSYQFATTSVTVSVQVESLHRPQFQKLSYEGVVSSVGTMVMDLKDEPLFIIALDEDYSATEGLNPNINYNIKGSSDFAIIDSYLFMTKDLPEGTLFLEVVAEDTSTKESATANLTMEVKSGLTTTSLPLSTTDIMVTTSTGESTTNSKTTEDIVSTTNPSTSTDSISTTLPSTTAESSTSSMSTEGSISTTNPISTSEESTFTASTTRPFTDGAIIPPGGYGPVDMAALGVTLGVLLFICLVVIGLLVHRIQRWKTDCRKISEASMFQRSLSQASGGNKDGIQYTNEAFHKDEDGRSTGSDSQDGGSVMAGKETLYENDSLRKSSLLLNSTQHDDASLTGSDKTDSEKDVKPILTKERRMEEGYKSVWFKEDIDPDAKEEVVIIPDSREDDSEEEDEEQSSSDREEDEDDNLPIKTPKVVFADAELDSGLGVKMGDPAEDSEDDEVLNVEL
ncbi:cadherin-related family member 5 isoform X1 [Thunnus albacares]|uniref:cadherin-related family member 5 isoform X1 n=1 Tax=Thunnus albacares TaxID=8236 RepID=UPI001CF614A2|nr:cadherin-related family member 5 isoform X1 [Thunnus albacares]